jgi:hypothetical protein
MSSTIESEEVSFHRRSCSGYRDQAEKFLRVERLQDGGNGTAWLSLFASAAVPEMIATTGMPRVAVSAFSRSTTAKAVHLRHEVVKEDQV